MKSILRKISKIENHWKSIGKGSLRTTNRMQHLKYICFQFPRAMVYSCGFSAMFLKGKISFTLQVVGSNTVAVCVLVFAKDFNKNVEISEHEQRLLLVNFSLCISFFFLFLYIFFVFLYILFEFLFHFLILQMYWVNNLESYVFY